MLTELTVRNFAIIDELSLTFYEGLTVLTGETGAGKSILIDAIQLLSGQRGSTQFVRHGAKKAEIEGLFSIHQDHPIHQIGESYGVMIEDEMIVLHRTITSSGKSICRVNGKLVTLAILREFGQSLIDIHGQHETQFLTDASQHIEFLDLYNPSLLQATKNDYTYFYDQYNKLKKKYEKLSENEQELTHRLDLLTFQYNEIENAHLKPNEDIELEEKREQLIHFEKIFLGLQDAYEALNGEHKAIDWLNQAQMTLQENKDFDSFIAKKAEQLTNHFYMIEDIMFELSNYKDQLHYDGDQLNEIEQRLNEINRLKKKYGPTVNDILSYMAAIEDEIDQIENKDSHLNHLLEQINQTKKDAFLEAQQLHAHRQKMAKDLEKEVEREMKALYLENATFSIFFDYRPLHDIPMDELTLHSNGFDQIRFLLSTNPGEPLKELGKIASGGELSRIMLILKKIFAKHHGITSVIFDEVDTGVSGRVAQAMAEKIYEISIDSQVLCITHLPQVAAMADNHKLISKVEQNERVVTTVNDLSEKEIVEEISRMITGTKITQTALEHGKNLLETATNFKKNYQKNQ